MSDPVDTPARVLQNAVRVFAARGYDGASTRDLAAAAGVNIATLNYHFGSKEQLYSACVDAVYARLRADAAALEALDRRDAPDVVRALWEVARRNADGIRILLREVVDHGELRPSTSSAHFMPLVTEAAARLSAAAGVPSGRARQLIATMGFLLSRFAVQSDASLREIFDLPADCEPDAIDRRVVDSLTRACSGFLLPV